MPTTQGHVEVRHLQTHDPAHPDHAVASVALLDDVSVDSAIERANAAQRHWAEAAIARVSALEEWANALARERSRLIELVVREVGKPVTEAAGEVGRAIAILRYYAQAVLDPTAEVFPTGGAQSRLEVERRPLGVVLVITPWNFPVAIPIWKIAPALAYGNTVLFRPSSAAVGIADLLVSLAKDAIPPDVLQLVPTRTDQVDRVLADHRIYGVSFTGSEQVGSVITQRVAARGGSVQAEMGGQNASIVLADADLDLAANVIAEAAMAFAGQKCTATSRVIVEREVADRFIPLLTDRIDGLPVGDPQLNTTLVGPLISDSARFQVDRAVQQALHRGGKLLIGGRFPDVEGWFYQPTLLAIDDPTDEFAQEETFGPAASVLIADSTDHAVRIANSTRYGLSGAVFGSDLDAASAVARQLNVGLIRVNAPTTGVEYYAPFGGEGASSYGPREQGKAAREFYTRTRTLVIRSVE